MSMITLEVARQHAEDARPFGAAVVPGFWSDEGLELFVRELDADRAVVADLARRRRGTLGGDRYASLLVAIAETRALLQGERDRRARARAEAKARLTLV